MRISLIAPLLAFPACTAGPAGGSPGDNAGQESPPPAESIVDAPSAPESLEIGNFSIKGMLRIDGSDEPVEDELCVEAVDQHDFARGQEPEVLAGTTADETGAFTLASLPATGTTGLVLRVYVCGGDASTWYPTMTLVPAEATTGLGPGDILDGQVAWVVPTEDARRIEAALLENGSPTTLDEAGAIVGQIFDDEGAPLAPAAVRGPDATRVHYDQGADIWLPYVNTTEEGEARFASPGAPWALWTCRAQAFNIPAVLAGAFPGWITRWDFRASENLSSGG